MLRDAVAASGLTFWSLIALVLFFAVFVAIVIWVVTRPKKDMSKQSQIPLDEDVVEPRDDPHKQ